MANDYLFFCLLHQWLFGAIAAIGQTNLKRLVAYSSIGHIGYIISRISATGSNDGLQSSIIYISIYIDNEFRFIFVFIDDEKKQSIIMKILMTLSGLSKNHPLLSFSSMLIILFSLAGIPPLAGFFAKFYIFKSVIRTINVFFSHCWFIINCYCCFLLS